jgi:hypothetical protein
MSFVAYPRGMSKPIIDIGLIRIFIGLIYLSYVQNRKGYDLHITPKGHWSLLNELQNINLLIYNVLIFFAVEK